MPEVTLGALKILSRHIDHPIEYWAVDWDSAEEEIYINDCRATTSSDRCDDSLLQNRCCKLDMMLTCIYFFDSLVDQRVYEFLRGTKTVPQFKWIANQDTTIVRCNLCGQILQVVEHLAYLPFDTIQWARRHGIGTIRAYGS
jgi:hypothetical protein